MCRLAEAQRQHHTDDYAGNRRHVAALHSEPLDNRSEICRARREAERAGAYEHGHPAAAIRMQPKRCARRRLWMEGGDSRASGQYQRSSRPEVPRQAEQRDEHARHRWRKHRKQPRVEAVGKISVGGLQERARKNHYAPEDACLRQREMELIHQQRLESAHSARIQIDKEMPERIEDEGEHPGAHHCAFGCSFALENAWFGAHRREISLYLGLNAMSQPFVSQHRPFVPENVSMKEFTLRAVLLGLVMTVILGAANAYLGLRAGITIAATYPAAVIGMAVLRAWKASVLEENIARTAGSIGESVAAGAIFTLPAFFLVKAWPKFDAPEVYWKSTALMLVGSVLGVLFVSLIRRVMVEDRELPYPESVAASAVDRAGQLGAQAAKYLFYNIGIGAVIFLGGQFGVYASDHNFFFNVGSLGRSTLRLGPLGSQQVLNAGGVSTVAGPSVSPAFLGVGYIIGPELAALNFSGSVVAWGLLIPLLIFFLGPQLRTYLAADAKPEDWLGLGNAVWRYIVRPVAVGSMMGGTCYTLFRMPKNLGRRPGKAFPGAAPGARAPQSLGPPRGL